MRHDAKRDCQPQTLHRALPKYHFVFQPAMSYPEDIFTRVEEGVAVYSRYPITSHSFILLSRNRDDGDDSVSVPLFFCAMCAKSMTAFSFLHFSLHLVIYFCLKI